MKNHEANKPCLNINLKVFLMIVFDAVFASVAFYISHTIVFFRITKDYSNYPIGYDTNILYIAFTCIFITIILLALLGNYKTIWKYSAFLDLFKYILAYILSSICIFVFKLVLWWYADINFWTPVIILFLVFSALFSGTIRYFTAVSQYYNFVKNSLLQNKGGAKRTIVIGAGYTGSLLVNRFVNNIHEGYMPVAIIDDNEEKQGSTICGIPIVCGIDKIEKAVKKYTPEVFVIAISTLTKSQLRKIYNACSQFKLPIKIAPQIADASLEISEKTLSLTDIKMEELLGRDEYKVNMDFINSSIKGKVVLVTGGAGSIGSELARQIIGFGCKHLVVFDNHENGMFFLNEEFKNKYDANIYSLVIGTIRDVDKLNKVFEEFKPDTVFHAAAYKHVPMMEISPSEAIKNNVLGTLNVINSAENWGVSKFVLVSTDKAVNPSNVMGASKRIAEMLIETKGKTSKMNMAAVRFGNVLGSNGSVIPIFLDQIKKGGPITLTDKNIKRYFMSIPEAVKLVLQTGAFANNGEIFVLDMGEPVYIYDLACDLIRLNGLEPEKDIEILVTGLRPGEKMFEELRYDNELVDTTLHDGIFVNKMEDIDLDTFNLKLQELINCAMDENQEKLTKLIFEMVPNKYRN
ncbi:MAG: polysaccharide biosynthesis protein [Clostridia bacterium]|nr:polysaccharide biosynthesis protein [Clostridia bacterium]